MPLSKEKLLQRLLFEAENRFSYWDAGEKKIFRSSVAPGEHLVSETGVTCFSHTTWGWSRSGVWHVASLTQPSTGLCCNRSCWILQIPSLTSWVSQQGFMVMTFQFPQMPLSVQPHSTVKQRCSQEITASLKLLSSPSYLSFQTESVWGLRDVAERMTELVVLFTQGICSREFFSLAGAGSFKIYFFIRVLYN